MTGDTLKKKKSRISHKDQIIKNMHFEKKNILNKAKWVTMLKVNDDVRRNTPAIASFIWYAKEVDWSFWANVFSAIFVLVGFLVLLHCI